MKFEPAQCKNCIYYMIRPDMKSKVKYCIKRNFAIYDDGKMCTKYIRRLKDNG